VAEEIFAAWKVEVARERWLGPRPADQHYTVTYLIDKYLTVATPRKVLDSQRRDRSVLAAFTLRWGTLGLCDLTGESIEEYLACRVTQVTYATASKELGILKAAYHAARRWGWISSTPFVGIKLNQSGEGRIRWLTDEEERLILSRCPRWLHDLVIVGVDTGLRPGNLVGLQRSWVHHDHTVLIVPQPYTKTRRAPITIPLTSRAREIIVRWSKASSPHERLVSHEGLPLTCSRVNNALRRLAQKMGLNDIWLYVLRHTFVTRLVQAGRPMPEVATLAGHRSIVTTMRYVHVAPQYLRDGIRALESNRPGNRTTNSGVPSPTLRGSPWKHALPVRERFQRARVVRRIKDPANNINSDKKKKLP
jgi:integrase